MKFCFVQKDFIDKELNPDKLAVIGSDFELTWKEFSTKVDELCTFLTKNNCSQLKDPVIIYGHKSANMLVAMYALMKMEIPYIPIDFIYPMDRVLKIASISKSKLLINTGGTDLCIENMTEINLGEDIEIRSSNPLDKTSDKASSPLVYIIFTSGSTGDPKGVQIGTEAVQSFTRWMTNDFGFNENDVFVNSAVLSFDLSVFEVMTFGALGATLLLNDKNCTSDLNLMIPRIEKYKGSIWVSTPSFALLYSRLKEEKRLDSISCFLFCGEVLPHDLAQKLVINYPLAKVFNTYGPTEATVATTLIEIDQNILDAYNPLPVGKSKRESQLLIENEEIIIVGPNVSHGYVGNDSLNNEKFTIIDGQRAFKTGDKGYLEHDMLFFSGRDDDLVKLHGYRIELNEISSAINDLDYVMQGETIALKRNGSVKKIVSLVQLNHAETIDSNRIKEDISKRLPSYMVPSDIRIVDRIPLNQNGKADKKILTELYMKR